MLYFKDNADGLYQFAEDAPDSMYARFTSITKAEYDTANASTAHISTYQELRAAEFAKRPITEQMDMQYWDAVNGTTVWIDWVAGIKAMYPKWPTS